MVLKHLLNFFKRDRSGRPKLLIHLFQFFTERITQVAPQYGLLTVEHVSGADRICVFKVIAESQCAFVVDAECSIKVIRQYAPLVSAKLGRERVLGTAIHHQEKLREQVVEQYRVHFHIIRQFVPEFGQTVLRVVIGIRPAAFAVHIRDLL